MLEIISICFAIALFTLGLLALMYDGAKKDIIMYQRLNDTLSCDNKRLNNKNQFLLDQIETISLINEEQKKEILNMLDSFDINEYKTGSKISWINNKGNLEIGEVVDDSKVDGKTFVHVRRINKKGNFVGGVISLPSNKIKLEN